MKTIIRLIGFVQKYWFMLVLAFLSQVLGTAFGIIIPRFLGEGIDTVLGSGERNMIIIAAVMMGFGAVAMKNVVNIKV